MIVFPNAKINFGLSITRRREDGYHDIESWMIPVGWSDVLEIVPAKGAETTLTVYGRGVDCPLEKNLVMKAYRALNEVVELPTVDIYLQKIIPDGAGLGGGSSDAAFTLTALNELFKLDLDKRQLAEIAAGIGADCPFFVYNRPAAVSGIGTKMEALESNPLKGQTILIIKPERSVSTKEAYAGVTPAALGIFGGGDGSVIPEKAEWTKVVKNDFENSVAQKLPEISQIKSALYEGGAIYASMSGSGSAVYGLFDNDKMAEAARAKFRQMPTYLGRIDK